MSLYAEYVKERLGREILETSEGFVTFEFTGKVCYIVDIYVRPECRNSKAASRFADEITQIAKSEGCTHLIGSVALTANGATESIMVLCRYGFKVSNYADNLLWFAKEIGE